MALGDYVETTAGALAKGASAIAAAILQRGGSGTEAAAALSNSFPSLSGQIIGGLVSGTRQQLAAGQTEFRGGGVFGAPSLTVAGVGDIPTFQRVTIRATVTGSDGTVSTSTHVVDQQPGQTLADANATVMGRLSLIYEGETSPELGEELEGEDVVDVETSVVAVEQRSGG